MLVKWLCNASHKRSTEPIPDLLSYSEKPCVAINIYIKVITIVTVSLEAHLGREILFMTPRNP